MVHYTSKIVLGTREVHRGWSSAYSYYLFLCSKNFMKFKHITVKLVQKSITNTEDYRKL